MWATTHDAAPGPAAGAGGGYAGLACGHGADHRPRQQPAIGRCGRLTGPDSQWPKGFHSILEKRAMETLQTGQAQTAYLRWGDTVRIDLKGRDGGSPLGETAGAVLEPDQD